MNDQSDAVQPEPTLERRTRRRFFSVQKQRLLAEHVWPRAQPRYFRRASADADCRGSRRYLDRAGAAQSRRHRTGSARPHQTWLGRRLGWPESPLERRCHRRFRTPAHSAAANRLAEEERDQRGATSPSPPWPGRRQPSLRAHRNVREPRGPAAYRLAICGSTWAGWARSGRPGFEATKLLWDGPFTPASDCAQSN